MVGGVDESGIASGAVQPREDAYMAHDLGVAPAAQDKYVSFLEIVEIGDVHLPAVPRLVFRRPAQIVVAEVAEDVSGISRAVEMPGTVRRVAVGGP